MQKWLLLVLQPCKCACWKGKQLNRKKWYCLKGAWEGSGRGASAGSKVWNSEENAGCRKNSPNKEVCGQGQQPASAEVEQQPLGHLTWEESTLQGRHAWARIRSSNWDFPGIVPGTMEQAEIAFYQTRLSSGWLFAFRKVAYTGHIKMYRCQNIPPRFASSASSWLAGLWSASLCMLICKGPLPRRALARPSLMVVALVGPRFFRPLTNT